MTSTATRRALLAGTAASLAGLRTTPVRADDARVARVQSDDEVLSWDPHGAWHTQSIIAAKHVYETLVHIEPGLATSWRLAGPTAWEIELRPGVRFHDGTPLTVEDVAFSLARAKGEGSEFRRYAKGIVRVEDAGGGKARVVTERPDPLMPVR